MNVPWWFLAISALCAAAYFAVAFNVLRNRLMRAWPSVFVISIEQVTVFGISQALRNNYPLYFKFYYAHVAIANALDLWLTWDIARSIPSSQWFPKRVKSFAWLGAFAAGIIAALYTAPAGMPATLQDFRVLEFSANFTFWAVAAWLLVTVMTKGIGFSATGMRVTIGAIFLKLSSFFTSLLLNQPHVSRTVRRTINTSDTVISMLVALLWAYAIADALHQELRQRREWAVPP